MSGAADVRAGKLLLLNKLIIEDDLSSQTDGIETTFTAANNYVGSTLRVFLNGLRQQSGVGKDFQQSPPNQLVMTVAPDAGDILLIDYIKE